MATKKKATVVRLSDGGNQFLEALARKYGVSRTAIMEIAIREKAERDKVAIPEESPQAVAA